MLFSGNQIIRAKEYTCEASCQQECLVVVGWIDGYDDRWMECLMSVGEYEYFLKWMVGWVDDGSVVGWMMVMVRWLDEGWIDEWFVWKMAPMETFREVGELVTWYLMDGWMVMVGWMLVLWSDG